MGGCSRRWLDRRHRERAGCHRFLRPAWWVMVSACHIRDLAGKAVTPRQLHSELAVALAARPRGL